MESHHSKETRSLTKLYLSRDCPKRVENKSTNFYNTAQHNTTQKNIGHNNSSNNDNNNSNTKITSTHTHILISIINH